jgi:methionyl-tRNA formyltransferase
MKVVFFGTPEFAVPTLRRLVRGDHRVTLVVSRPDKPVGRHQVLSSPPVVELANKLGLPVIQPKSLKGQEVAQMMRGAGVDIGVVVAYGRLIPPGILGIPHLGIINLHPSLLPRHRGPSPIQWALATGDTTTGVTTMVLDEGMDTGPLLLQESVEILPLENAADLSARLAEVGAELVVRTLDGLATGTVAPEAQPDEGANVTPMIRRSFAKVDWSMPARQLVNRLRAFTPWPGLYTKFRGGRLKLHGLEEVRQPPHGAEEAGTVLWADAQGIVLRCGWGTAVRITELQREGRRRMPADAFLIGERVVAGELFG